VLTALATASARTSTPCLLRWTSLSVRRDAPKDVAQIPVAMIARSFTLEETMAPAARIEKENICANTESEPRVSPAARLVTAQRTGGKRMRMRRPPPRASHAAARSVGGGSPARLAVLRSPVSADAVAHPRGRAHQDDAVEVILIVMVTPLM
jgi:hypothetical protein